jgi:quercetin dioxygenase-like cupin family protein
VTLKAGDVLFIPAGTIHAAANVGNDKGAELATFRTKRKAPRHAGEVSARCSGQYRIATN